MKTPLAKQKQERQGGKGRKGKKMLNRKHKGGR